MNNLKPYLKSILAGVVTIGYSLQAALSDDKFSADESGAIIALILTTLGVFTVPNKPADPTPVEAVTRDRAF